uniref:telomeric repeat-binding factor 2-interacting protein 1 isoform X2 n=1 Tax=Monopterus albus TaxID=43700 RepID=UPI0009B331D3|nr:telomeric repeat-binding factor 2-interacting protein 1 isoform X2 [Monopterus albus]
MFWFFFFGFFSRREVHVGSQQTALWDVLSMLSKRRHVAKSDISPVLFMTVDGEPMSFFLRPSPNKVKLQPLITAGGGLLCNVQRSGAILLIDPEERGSVPETSARWYVSTQYIYDCVERGEQLDVEHYRLKPEVVLRHSARLNNSKEGSPGLLGGRAAYTPEEDAAILSYVRNHMTQTGGNRLWQEMEKKCVTSHSWQSMKHRYKTQLAKKLSGVEEVKTIKEKTKEEGDKETEEGAVPPPHSPATDHLQTHSVETDLMQIDAQPIAVDSTPANVEDQTCSSLQEEVQHVKPQTDVPAAESTQAEIAATETSGSPQPKGLCLDSQTDVHPIPAESTEPKRAKAQSVISPQKGTVLDSPMVEQPQRRITRRQLVLEPSSSPETYGKKLRSSSTSAEKPSSSPQPLKKTKSAVKSPLQKDSAVDQSPSKRAKGKTVAAVEESQREESEEATVSERPPSDQELNPLLQKGEKKKEKRKLGILELATKEFESESESGEDETPDLQNPVETVMIQSTSTEPPVPPSDTPADPSSTQSSPQPRPSLQMNVQDAHKASRAHLFIFDSDSQEDDTQSPGDNTAAPAKPYVNEDAALPLTQVQLEEDRERIIELMDQTKQDLVSVIKALMKTSGDIPAALDLLLDPSSVSGPFWNRYDDGLLLSADAVLRQQLQEKYGLGR